MTPACSSEIAGLPRPRSDIDLHEKIDRKKELLYKDELPASVLEELALEIIQLKSQIRAEAGDILPTLLPF